MSLIIISLLKGFQLVERSPYQSRGANMECISLSMCAFPNQHCSVLIQKSMWQTDPSTTSKDSSAVLNKKSIQPLSSTGCMIEHLALTSTYHTNTEQQPSSTTNSLTGSRKLKKETYFLPGMWPRLYHNKVNIQQQAAGQSSRPEQAPEQQESLPNNHSGNHTGYVYLHFFSTVSVHYRACGLNLN